jgi:hypothetical protein
MDLFSLTSMVAANSSKVSRAPLYLGTPTQSQNRFRIRGYHPLWPAVPDRSANYRFCNSAQGRTQPVGPTTPPTQRLHAYT